MTIGDLPNAKEAASRAWDRALEIRKKREADEVLRADERSRQEAWKREERQSEILRTAHELITKFYLADDIISKIRDAIDRGRTELQYAPHRPGSDPWVKWSKDIGVINKVYELITSELNLKELGYQTSVQDDVLVISWK